MCNIASDYPAHAKPFISMPYNLDLCFIQLILISFFFIDIFIDRHFGTILTPITFYGFKSNYS